MDEISDRDNNCLVYDPPNTVREFTVGEFTFELNDIDELRISNKFEPAAFVLEGEVLVVLEEMLKWRRRNI